MIFLWQLKKYLKKILSVQRMQTDPFKENPLVVDLLVREKFFIAS